MCGKIGGRKNTPCFAHVPEPGKCLLVESGILGFEIRAQGIRNPANYWNQESGLPRQGIWNPVSGVRHPLREIKNPRLSLITLYGASLLRSAEAQRGMARVSVENQKHVIEPVRKGETLEATC